MTRKPVETGPNWRIDQKRVFDIKAGVLPDLTRVITTQDGTEKEIFVNANERIEHLTRYLKENLPLKGSIGNDRGPTGRS